MLLISTNIVISTKALKLEKGNLCSHDTVNEFFDLDVPNPCEFHKVDQIKHSSVSIYEMSLALIKLKAFSCKLTYKEITSTSYFSEQKLYPLKLLDQNLPH